MSLELTFREVGELIKKDEPKLIEAVDKLLGLTLVCSPILLGAAAVAALPALTVKNELTKLGKDVFSSYTSKRDSDYVLRQQRMHVAYCLLCFTAFFEALDEALPVELRKSIALQGDEKTYLAKRAVARVERQDAASVDSSIINFPMALPHPTESLAEQTKRHAQLWKQLSDGFLEFIYGLAVWDSADEREKAEVIAAVRAASDQATIYFESQYFELARKYEDFAVWANLQEHKNTKALIESLSDYVQRYVALAQMGNDSLDIGFAKLQETVLSLPQIFEVQHAKEICDGLKRHYFARIDEPIIEERDETNEDQPRLSFPRIRALLSG